MNYFKNKKQWLQPFKVTSNNDTNTLDTGWERLRISILKQAVVDYIGALRTDDEKGTYELERFFRSDWGQLLSDYNGELIISVCKRKANNRTL